MSCASNCAALIRRWLTRWKPDAGKSTINSKDCVRAFTARRWRETRRPTASCSALSINSIHTKSCRSGTSTSPRCWPATAVTSSTGSITRSISVRTSTRPFTCRRDKMPAKKTPTSLREELVLPEVIENRIFIIRDQKVMLSNHLAELYQVEARVLIQAVKRNAERFPPDFMFQLTRDEWDKLKSQIVISSWGGSRRATPYAFTEQGIAMLSSVLRSKRAIKVNIEVMRAFVSLRQMLASNEVLARKLADLEKRYDRQFKIVFDAIRHLMSAPVRPGRQIGFKPAEK